MSKSRVFKSLAPIALPMAGMALAPMTGGASLGLSSAALSGIGGALGGAAAGGLTGGGLKGALMGGAAGGLGGYGYGGGFDSLGSGGGGMLTSGATPTDAAYSFGAPAGIGSTAGGQAATMMGSGMTPLTIGAGSSVPSGTFSAPSTGSMFSRIMKGAQDSGSMPGGGTTNALSSIYSGIQGDSAYKDMARAQQAANERAMGAVSPYMQTGEAANTRLSSLLGLSGEDDEDILSNLRSSPGYQFRQEQGQDALSKMLSAQGGLQSGRAIKESQRIGQGIADQTYNDYIKNLSAQQSQGRGAAMSTMPYQGMGGDIEANKIRSRQLGMDKTLADLMNPRRAY